MNAPNHPNTRLIKAPLTIEFSQILDNEQRYKDEFDLFFQNDDDPVGAWIRNAKARGKIVDENEPIVELLVELHRKIDALNAVLNNSTKNYIALDSTQKLESIGHSLLVFSANLLESSRKYYARLDMAVFPQRKIPLFFEALDSKNARIYLMHNRDEVDFDNYIASKERAFVREQKLIKDKI